MYKSVRKSKLSTFFCIDSNFLSYFYDLKQYQKYALFTIQFSLKIENSFNFKSMQPQSNIFLSLLEALEVPHTRRYTLRAYEEHPYKYTFYGLKMLCEKYGVAADGVLMKDKAEITRLTVPFVADHAHDHVLVKQLSDEQVKFEIYGTTSFVALEDFKKKWSGRALLFRPDKNSAEPDYAAHRRALWFGRLEQVVLAVSLLVLLGAGVWLRTWTTWVDVAILLLALLGAGLSAILLSQQLNVHNAFVEKVCHAFKKSSCNNVLESKAAKVLGRYSWSEIGFSYFVVNFVSLLLWPDSLTMLAYIGVLALPNSLWSIWYQRRIAQWCPICLLVQGVILLQFGICLAGGLYAPPFHLGLLPAGCLPVAYAMITLVLNKSLPLLTREAELQQTRWQYNHLKMNETVFETLLSAGTNYPVDGSSIFFGNRQAKLCVTVFSNPYCNPCAAMHRRLERVVSAGGCRLQYVFTAFRPEWNTINKNLIAVYQQFGAEKAWKVYTEWYDRGKIKEEAFFKPYRLNAATEEVDREFKSHEQWRATTGFSSTPTLLVNGHKLPDGYVVDDIPYFA